MLCDSVNLYSASAPVGTLRRWPRGFVNCHQVSSEGLTSAVLSWLPSRAGSWQGNKY